MEEIVYLSADVKWGGSRDHLTTENGGFDDCSLTVKKTEPVPSNILHCNAVVLMCCFFFLSQLQIPWSHKITELFAEFMDFVHSCYYFFLISK